MNLETIEQVLTSPQIFEEWTATLATWEEAEPGESDEALRRITALRDDFLQAARDIDDPETLDMITAIRYIELKSHWILLNTQINYLAAVKNANNFALAYEASLVSQLLAVLETLINEGDISRIIEFLSQPVANGALL